MLKFYVLLFAFCTVHSASQSIESWNILKVECEPFLNEYTIQLSDLEYSTYAANVAALIEMNEHVSWEAGENCFTLLDELQLGMFTQLDGIPLPSVAEPTVGSDADDNNVEDILDTADTMPDSYNHLDELQLTAARNQGGCGSCWAFAGLSCLESAWIRYTGQWYEDVDFSEQQLLDCTFETTKSRDACKGGWMTEAWQRIATNEDNKLCSEKDYPYSGKDSVCDANNANKPNAFSKLKLIPFSRYHSSGSDVFLWYSDKRNTTKTDNAGNTYVVMAEFTARVVWQNFSVSVAIQAEKAFFNYERGIFNTHSDKNKINHAVTIFGYTQEYFNIQNSWGTSTWGINGNGMITRRHGNMLQMFNYMMYPRVNCTYGVNVAGYCKGAGTDAGCLCYNGGLCKSDGSCVCKNGHTGKTCQSKDGKDCECKNGGTCLSTGKCKCPVNWTGDKCESEDYCSGCVNGKCVSSKCQCDKGYTGDKCDKKEDEGNCGCMNGGTCNVNGGCTCKNGFSGDKCEKKEITCTKKCRRGRQCYWKDATRMGCKCPYGSYGKGCTGKPDCSMTEKRVCKRIAKRKPDKFTKKCSKNWGPKKCPISCGYCKN